MAAGIPASAHNALLESLSRSERDACLGLCEAFELAAGDVVAEINAPFQHAYFPIGGVIALVSSLRNHHPLEMALIGQEGMLGATLLLGIVAAPIRAVVHVPGPALRISTAGLQSRLRESLELRVILGRYLYMHLVELSLVGGCIRYHRVEQRLARSLLRAQDRARSNQFNLTHGDLADMLGVRRSSVTIAAGDLQARKLISYSRGGITIVDRAGLEAASCECYGALQSRKADLRNETVLRP